MSSKERPLCMEAVSLLLWDKSRRFLHRGEMCLPGWDKLLAQKHTAASLCSADWIFSVALTPLDLFAEKQISSATVNQLPQPNSQTDQKLQVLFLYLPVPVKIIGNRATSNCHCLFSFCNLISGVLNNYLLWISPFSLSLFLNIF